MTPQELLLVTFCTIDDELKALPPTPLRARGPRPALADSEVITIEVVAELLGRHDDAAIYRHFRRYHAAELVAGRAPRQGPGQEDRQAGCEEDEQEVDGEEDHQEGGEEVGCVLIHN